MNPILKAFSGSTFKRALFVLAFPLAQYLLLRLGLRYALDLRIGWKMGTDFDFIFPIPTAFLIFFAVLDQENPLIRAFSKKTLALDLIALIAFTAVSFLIFSPESSPVSWGLYLLWWSFAIPTLLIPFFLFVSPRQVLESSHLKILAPCILIALAPTIYQATCNHLWTLIAPMTTSHSADVLQWIFGKSVSVDLRDSKLFLMHPNLVLRIEQGCSGLDGALLFVFTYSMVLFAFPNRFSFGVKFLGAISGVLMMYCLNILRIVLLFCIGALGGGFADFVGVSLFVMFKLFHAHAGWILYCGALLHFYRLLFVFGVAKQRASIPSFPLAPAAAGK